MSSFRKGCDQRAWVAASTQHRWVNPGFGYLKVAYGSVVTLQIFLFSTGCGHCKAMKPAYGEAARKLKTDGVGF